MDSGAETSRSAMAPRAQRDSNTINRLESLVLTLDEFRQMTDNFSDEQLIGKGGFGRVYKEVLTNGDEIAIKRFALTITGHEDVQYENEAQLLMRLKHPNIVQLLGCGSKTEMEIVPYNGTYVQAEKREWFLYLEYMPKGSLRDLLLDKDKTSGLEWNMRYKIIEGICYGLHYLHEEWQAATPIIHMDLKPENILLDDNMVPKIADFGLSRLFAKEQTRICTRSRTGTRGYMAPEYLENGLITKKLDIFSLRVIILEIITGRKDYQTKMNETTPQQYIDLVLNNWRRRLAEAQGYTSQDNDYRQIKNCIQIGLLCVKADWVKRPTINQIVEMLERSDEAYDSEREGSLKRLLSCGDGTDNWGFAASINEWNVDLESTLKLKDEPKTDRHAIRSSGNIAPDYNGPAIVGDYVVSDASNIIELLHSSKEKYCRLIAMDRMVGIGKTTLARWIYHRVEVGAGNAQHVGIKTGIYFSNDLSSLIMCTTIATICFWMARIVRRL